MRREGTLQDESLIESTLAGTTTLTQAFDYYLGWIADPSITVHYQPLRTPTTPSPTSGASVSPSTISTP